MRYKINLKLLPIGFILLLAFLLIFTLSQTDTVSGSGLFQSPLAPPVPSGTPVAPESSNPPLSPSVDIPLGKIPTYRYDLPIMMKNAQ